MLTGFSKEELAQMAKEFREKTENSIVELFEQAADYQIKTYDEMEDKLKAIQSRYEDEMADYDDNACSEDMTEFHIESMEKCKDSDSLQVYARRWLDVLDCVSRVTRPHWENDKGEICDENGRPLSHIDPDHSVFEVVKGGKQDKK